MNRSRKRPNARVVALVFGIIPCMLGVGLGQYLRWSGTVWLTDAGGFWPVFCFLASLLACVYLALTSAYDRTIRISAWLMLTWTWLYFPFWLTAAGLPRYSAIIGNDGRVTIAGEWMRPGADKAAVSIRIPDARRVVAHKVVNVRPAAVLGLGRERSQ